MTDKEYEAQKARVKKFIDKWYKAMGLDWFHVDMAWERERREDRPATVAVTTTTWQYRNAYINWYMPAVVDNDDDFLENIVVHEFVHILVAPLMSVTDQEDLPNHHEYATECIARALVWVREAGEKDAKKLQRPHRK